MKTKNLYVIVAVIVTMIASCTKSGTETTNVITPTVPASNPIAPGKHFGIC